MPFDLSNELKRLENIGLDWRINLDNKFKYELLNNGSLYLFIDGEKVPFPNFILRPYQQQILKELFVNNYRRIYLNWPRRAGKDFIAWIATVQAALMYPGKYIIVYPQCNSGNHILWEAQAYFNINGQHVAVRYLDMIPYGVLDRRNSTDKSLYFKNGSSIWVTGSDHNVDKLRGMNALGYVLSEYAFLRSDAILTGAVLPTVNENGGFVIIETTLKGMNHAYSLREKLLNGSSNDDIYNRDIWKVHVETANTLVDANGNRYITDKMINADRQTTSESKIRQEYYNDVSMDSDELYFALELDYIINPPIKDELRIISNLINTNKPMYAFYDIGIHDPTACVIAQFTDDKQIDIVNYFEGNNTALKIHLQRAEAFAMQYNSRIAKHFLPHDGANRNVFDGKPTVMSLREMGFIVDVVPIKSKEEGIEAVRVALSASNFNKENTERLLSCLSNYRKEFNPNTKMYRHVHDWSSHGVDAMQTLGLAYVNKLVGSKPVSLRYY